jgi:periplasmic divalent cation tolerance protein
VSNPAGVVQIQVAHDDREELVGIVEKLLSSRLIACGQIVGPIESHYWWQGKIETADEWLALCKTTAAAAPKAIEAIKQLHSYQVPEIVLLPIYGGLEPYLSWMAETVTSA